MKKRILAILMCACLLLAFAPTAFAEEGDAQAAEAETAEHISENDAAEIATAEDTATEPEIAGDAVQPETREAAAAEPTEAAEPIATEETADIEAVDEKADTAEEENAESEDSGVNEESAEIIERDLEDNQEKASETNGDDVISTADFALSPIEILENSPQSGSRASGSPVELSVNKTTARVNDNISFTVKPNQFAIMADIKAEGSITFVNLEIVGDGDAASSDSGFIVKEGNYITYNYRVNSNAKPGNPYTFTVYNIEYANEDGDEYKVPDIISVSGTIEGSPIYTVTFKDRDGKVLKTQTVEHGSSATPPTAPAITGYVFTGWSGNYSNIKANAVLSAQYREQTKTELATDASKLDPEKPSDAKKLEELEKLYKDKANISVSVSADNNTHGDFKNNVSAIKAVGAAFNANDGEKVTLHFSKPKNNVTIDGTQYDGNSAVQLDISLKNGNTELQNLKVPVTITVPIPTGVKAENFWILHYHADGSMERIKPTLNGDGTCTFTVKNFSVFVFTNEGVTIIKGDLMRKGKPTLGSFSLLGQYLLKTKTLDDYQLKAADMNGDGKVSMADFALLGKKLLGA